MTDLIRSACLTHFAEVATAAGLKPAALLRSVGLSPACLHDPDVRIATGGVRRLLEAAAAEGVDDFGLRLAERGGLSNLGPVALVVREQPTVGAAMAALARYSHIHNESLQLRIERHDDVVAIMPTLTLGRAVPARQSIELLIGVAYRILSAFLGAGWRPLDVHFAHGAPRNRERYRRFFACNVAFGADDDAIIVPASDMERPMPSANAALARYAQTYVESIAERAPTFDHKVRELIAALLPTGRCSIERVAEHLGCDRRTIHRQLLAAGTSFTDLVEARRQELILRLIDDRTRTLPAVAELLGFSAQSALARWFQQRFGCSITEWRLRTARKTAKRGKRAARA